MDRRVFLGARVRPLSHREASLRSKSVVLVQGDCTTVVNPATGDAKAFVLDFSYNSFDPMASGYASNRHVFNDVGAILLQNVWDGYNCCMFATGQSGSGKTHTLIGEEHDQGLIPQLLELLFQTIAKYEDQPGTTERVVVDCSFCEIHNEQVRDMLSRDYNPGGLKVRQRGESVYVEGLTKTRVNTMSDCEELLAAVLSALPTITPNAHTIFTVSLTKIPRHGKPTPENPAVRSKLHFVDLAGSTVEGASTPAFASKVKGSAKAGATPQDKSLLAWSNVLAALARQQSMLESGLAPTGVSGSGGNEYIPYRSSVLTRLLQDSMGERSRIVILACLSPSHHCYRETLNAFRYVVRSKESRRPGGRGVQEGENPEQQRAKATPLLESDSDGKFVPAAGGGWRWAYVTRGSDA